MLNKYFLELKTIGVLDDLEHLRILVISEFQSYTIVELLPGAKKEILPKGAIDSIL